MIPFINIRAQREAYKSEFLKAEQEVLDSGCFIGGPAVENLETELAKYTGAAHTITCASGTDALTIALLALGLKPGDEVIVPDFTFIAPAECVMRLGGIPKFADIDAETLQISPKGIEARIGEKTRGIIAVNLFGQCAPYQEIQKLAKAHGLWLIEDAAQSFGAKQNGVSACTFGDISITSFYPAKPLGCYGDGGALFTQDEALAQKIRLIANHGSRTRYVHEICGMNSRLDAIQAAVLCVKLRHLDDELKARRENARKYDEFFAEYNSAVSVNGDSDKVSNGAKVVPQKIAEGNTSTYAQYTVLADNREAFIAKLDAAGIPHCIHYPQPLHEQPCFRKLAQGCKNKNAIAVSQKVVSLPFCAFTDVDAIVEKLKQ
ncbi:MAG: DegT/DnrJ/EryC1/StrS family aminotransferase [Fibrobacter sp.]|nr:DegT/DnrJ/EryC1/StrS family aminotransferase [Fibrobacter sp.]